MDSTRQEVGHSWSRKWQSTPGFLPRKFHGQRNLASYNPSDHKESDITELLRTEHIHIIKIN